MTLSIKSHFAICVPALNAGPAWPLWLARTQEGMPAGTRMLVVDSSSDDDSARIAREAGAEVIVINRADFDHGATRDMALRHLNTDVVVFLTQDALLADANAIARLVAIFNDPQVGAAFGRQLPHDDATPIAAHARLFNYPSKSYTVDREDIPRLGIKTAFLSNSFAAYRRQALLDAGGFPKKVILSEDMLAGARLLQNGWKLAYCAEACVKHSHNYSFAEEFRRYFDIGVLHARERWLMNLLGKAEGEGLRFLKSELSFLRHRAPLLLPQAFLRTALKYLGYRLGKAERHLPLLLKKRCSMHRHFWGSMD